MKKLVVFDFDGVIVDSVSIKGDAFYSIAKDYDYSVASEFLDFHDKNGGIDRVTKFRYLFENLLRRSYSDEDIQSCTKNFSRMVKNKIISLPLEESFLDCVKIAKDHDYIIVLNTATPIEEINEILIQKHLDDTFNHVLGSPASKVENLRSLNEQFSIDWENSLFVGDAFSDFNAATHWRMNFYHYGNVRPDYLRPRDKQITQLKYLINEFTCNQ